MDEIIIYDLPYDSDSLKSIEEILRLSDVIVTPFSDFDQYSFFSYAEQRDLHSSEFRALFDFNVTLNTLRLARQDIADEKMRETAALLSFLIVTDTVFEIGFGMIEFVQKNLTSTACDFINLFRAADNVSPNIYADIALKRRVKLNQSDLPKIEEKLTEFMPEVHYNWDLHYMGLLGLVVIDNGAGRPIEKLHKYIRWMWSDFLFSAPCFLFASIYLSSRPFKGMLTAFGHLTLFETTTDLVSDYQVERLKTAKPATVYQELALMRRMFNVARREWKWTRDNPVADLSFAVGNKNARDRWLTLEEEQRLLDCATNPVWLRPLLIFALHTGMRKGEMLNLQWRETNFIRKIVTVIKSKNGEKRSIPMSGTLYDTLQDIKVRDISGRVFPISDRSLREAFKTALEKAGIENFRIHDLRHTFATRLVQNGVDLFKVKELLGHKTIAMTMRYAHHYPESLRASVEVLDSCHVLVTVKAGNV